MGPQSKVIVAQNKPWPNSSPELFNFLGLIWNHWFKLDEPWKFWVFWIFEISIWEKNQENQRVKNREFFWEPQNFENHKKVEFEKITLALIFMISPKIVDFELNKPLIKILKIHGIQPKYIAWITRIFSMYWIFEISSLIWVIFWNVFCLQAWRNIYSLWPHRPSLNLRDDSFQLRLPGLLKSEKTQQRKNDWEIPSDY